MTPITGLNTNSAYNIASDTSAYTVTIIGIVNPRTKQ